MKIGDVFPPRSGFVQQLHSVDPASSADFSAKTKLVARATAGQLMFGVVLNPAAHCGCTGKMMNKG